MSHFILHFHNFVMKSHCYRLFLCKCNKPFRYNKANFSISLDCDIQNQTVFFVCFKEKLYKTRHFNPNMTKKLTLTKKFSGLKQTSSPIKRHSLTNAAKLA